MTARICVIGSVNRDIFVNVPHIPAAGETLLALDRLTCVGGKGANQAVAACRAGAEVTFVGAVGDDAAGRDAKAALTATGVDCQYIATVATDTGSALVAVNEQGDNSIIVMPGANFAVDPATVDAAREAVAAAAAVLVQLEIPPATLLHIAALAASVGTPLIVNAAPMPANCDDLLPLLESCDCLIVNELEAAALYGSPTEFRARSAHVGVARSRLIVENARGKEAAHADRRAGSW